MKDCMYVSALDTAEQQKLIVLFLLYSLNSYSSTPTLNHALLPHGNHQNTYHTITVLLLQYLLNPQSYITPAVVKANSSLPGKAIGASELAVLKNMNIELLKIMRGEETIVAPKDDVGANHGNFYIRPYGCAVIAFSLQWKEPYNDAMD